MEEDKIQELLTNLYKLEYEWESGSDKYKSKVIKDEGKDKVENLIKSFLLENRDKRIGRLESKVFMYEEIIKKSNFAPMVDKILTK